MSTVTADKVPAELRERIRVTHALASAILLDVQRLEGLNRDLLEEWTGWLDTLGPWATSVDGYETILNPAEEAAGMDALFAVMGALVRAADDAYCPRADTEQAAA